MFIVIAIVAAATLAFLGFQRRRGKKVTEIGLGYLLISVLCAFLTKAAVEEHRPEFAIGFVAAFVVVSVLLVASYLFERRTARRQGA